MHGENFSISADKWRQFGVCNCGTFARAHALLKQAESIASDLTGPYEGTGSALAKEHLSQGQDVRN
jgi:hypothetical protein